MRSYGNIPDEVLDFEIMDWDENYTQLKYLIDEATDQDVIEARIVMGDYEGETTLESFSAWTKDHILVLVSTTFGKHLMKYDRNP